MANTPVLDSELYDTYRIRKFRGPDEVRNHYFGDTDPVVIEIVTLGPCTAKVVSAEGHVPVLTSITTDPAHARQGAATAMLTTLPRPLRTSPRTEDGNALFVNHPDIAGF